MMLFKITTFTIGHLNANSQARIVIKDTSLGSTATFYKFPRSWSTSHEKYEYPGDQACRIIDELVREHPVLGSPGALVFLGYELKKD